jgi:hypothetical protein
MLWGSGQNLSGDQFVEGGAERGLDGVTNLTIKRQDRTGCQKRRVFKRKAVLKEAENSGGSCV